MAAISVARSRQFVTDREVERHQLALLKRDLADPEIAMQGAFLPDPSIFAGYVASRTIPAGGDYLIVFRVVGTTAFMGYALGLWQMTIWYQRSVTTTLKSTFDGLLYACLTAGAFGWLWPAA